MDGEAPVFALSADCYVLAEADPADPAGTRHVAYFPIQSLVLRVNARAAGLLERLREGPLQPVDVDEAAFLAQLVQVGVVNGRREHRPGGGLGPLPRPTRCMLLTSDRCNLRCVYCYGKAETHGDLMPLAIARAAVDMLLANAVALQQPAIDVSFHGGGEPTLNWPVLRDVIEYAEERSRALGKGLTSTLCTNGLLDEAQVDWLAAHVPNVVVSFDGPPELQNAQRPLASGGPSFERVATTMRRLRERDKPFVVRLTATALAEGRLVAIYDYILETFRPRTICIEPLFVCGRCETSDARPPRAEVFAEDMVAALARARQTGVAAAYSGGRLSYLSDRFCGAAGANFFVTPRGEVTSCVEVSHPDDPRSELFLYGHFDAATGTFVFDEERYRRLVNLTVHTWSACRDCFARWHCAGDCPVKAPEIESPTAERNAYRCAINQRVTAAQIFAYADHAQERARRTP